MIAIFVIIWQTFAFNFRIQVDVFPEKVGSLKRSCSNIFSHLFHSDPLISAALLSHNITYSTNINSIKSNIIKKISFITKPKAYGNCTYQNHVAVRRHINRLISDIRNRKVDFAEYPLVGIK